MINTEPKVCINGRYSIEETAEVLGVHRNTVRKYAKEGKLRFSVRKTNNRLFFEGKDIISCWQRCY